VQTFSCTFPRYKSNKSIRYHRVFDITLLCSKGLIVSFVLACSLVFFLMDSTIASLSHQGDQQDGNNETEHYQTLQKLINNTKEGERLFLPPGIYHEHLIVNKSITLIGADNHSTILNGSGTGIIMYISASNVSLSNCLIEHGNIGIYLKGSNKNSQVALHNITVSKTNASMYLSRTSNVSLLHSILEESVDGITLYNSSYITLLGNVIRNNSNIGIELEDGSHHNTINANHLILNRQGIRLCRNSYNNTISNNSMVNNTIGIHLEFTSHTMVTDNVFIHNDCGIRIQYSQGNNSFFCNIFRENSCAISMMDSTDDVPENNTFINNTMNLKQESSVPQINTPDYGLAFLLGAISIVALLRKSRSIL
jgi:parallel beta-helix repeat protein